LFSNTWHKTDQDLIKSSLDGHDSAWESLISRYQRLVYHFPHGARMSAEDCDEVFQETFLSLYRNLEKLRDVKDMGRWVATIAKRQTWKLVQRNRHYSNEPLQDDYNVEDPDLIPEESWQIKVQQSQIRQAFSQLNGSCRKVLYLLFFEYDSTEYERVAADADIARGSIGALRRRCLVKLEKILARMGINEHTVVKWLT